MQKELYTKETNWGTHTVTAGYGKNTGKFVAQSFGHGGARGYFRVFDTLEQATAFVDDRTKPLPKSDVVSF